jgi:hypothetical protein
VLSTSSRRVLRRAARCACGPPLRQSGCPVLGLAGVSVQLRHVGDCRVACGRRNVSSAARLRPIVYVS